MAYVGSCANNIESIVFAKISNYTSFTRIEGNPYIEPKVGFFDSDGCEHPDLFMKPPYNILTYSGFDGTNRSKLS